MIILQNIINNELYIGPIVVPVKIITGAALMKNSVILYKFKYINISI
jgi:hypothetical protein